MTAENTLIRKLETFLDQEFNDFSKKRILSYIKEYRDDIPPIFIKREHIKNIFGDQEFPEQKRKSYKVLVTKEELTSDAIELCKIHKIEISDFLDRSHKKASTRVVELRKIFCKMAYEKYICNNNALSKFFNIHYSTISFYLYGKRYIPKNKKSNNLKLK